MDLGEERRIRRKIHLGVASRVYKIIIYKTYNTLYISKTPKTNETARSIDVSKGCNRSRDISYACMKANVQVAIIYPAKDRVLN